jgi:hypothetical protein
MAWFGQMMDGLWHLDHHQTSSQKQINIAMPPGI